MARRILFALAIALLATAPVPAQTVTAGIGERVANAYARPTLSAFEGSANALSKSLRSVCASPTPAGLDAVRRAFADTVAAFAPVSILRFGPLTAENRFERLFFWPDARGVTGRQVAALIAAADEAAVSPNGLSGKSVAVQGLAALDLVLSDTEALIAAPQTYSCRYGAAIAENVATIAVAAAAAWAPESEFAQSFTAPGPGLDPYRSDDEVAAELVEQLGTGLRFIRDAELRPALGENVEQARGRRAPLWRSDLTFVLVRGQIDGLAALLAAAELESALKGEARSNLQAIAFDLRYAGEAIAAIATTAEAAFVDATDRERIRYVSVALTSALENINERLPADLGLTMGFNALDGD